MYNTFRRGQSTNTKGETNNGSNTWSEQVRQEQIGLWEKYKAILLILPTIRIGIKEKRMGTEKATSSYRSCAIDVLQKIQRHLDHPAARRGLFVYPSETTFHAITATVAAYGKARIHWKRY